MVVAITNAGRRNRRTEPWRTILPEGAHLALVSQMGWSVDLVVGGPVPAPDTALGRSLFVTARPSVRSGHSTGCQDGRVGYGNPAGGFGGEHQGSHAGFDPECRYAGPRPEHP
jgi:hypothetical protein